MGKVLWNVRFSFSVVESPLTAVWMTPSASLIADRYRPEGAFFSNSLEDKCLFIGLQLPSAPFSSLTLQLIALSYVLIFIRNFFVLEKMKHFFLKAPQTTNSSNVVALHRENQPPANKDSKDFCRVPLSLPLLNIHYTPSFCSSFSCNTEQQWHKKGLKCLVCVCACVKESPFCWWIWCE